LLSLAANEHAFLVSGDGHVLALAGDFPIHTPASYLVAVPDPAGSGIA